MNLCDKYPENQVRCDSWQLSWWIWNSEPGEFASEDPGQLEDMVLWLIKTPHHRHRVYAVWFIILASIKDIPANYCHLSLCYPHVPKRINGARNWSWSRLGTSFDRRSHLSKEGTALLFLPSLKADETIPIPDAYALSGWLLICLSIK